LSSAVDKPETRGVNPSKTDAFFPYGRHIADTPRHLDQARVLNNSLFLANSDGSHMVCLSLNGDFFVAASRSGSNGGGTNNLPPLLFHNVHGENIRISRDGTIARRVESFCKGIAFSSRPVKINEKVSVKEVTTSVGILLSKMTVTASL
jgi:hypothetical protein